MTLVSDLTPYLTAADGQIAQLTSVNASLTTQVSGLTLQVADLTARLAAVSPPPGSIGALPAGWTKTLFADDFTGDLSKWNVRDTTSLSSPNTQDNMDGVNFARNVTVKDSVLSIRSGADSGVAAKPWSCGYLDTKGGKFSVRNGRFEARIRHPWGASATGFWGAFWLRPDDGRDGELDGVEFWPARNEVGPTIHHDYLKSSDPAHVSQVAYRLPTPLSIDPAQWHTYAIEKEAGSLKFYVDDRLISDMSAVPWRVAQLERAVNWHIRLNLQIGGSWGGKPTAATNLAQTFDVDWVRVLGR